MHPVAIVFLILMGLLLIAGVTGAIVNVVKTSPDPKKLPLVLSGGVYNPELPNKGTCDATKDLYMGADGICVVCPQNNYKDQGLSSEGRDPVVWDDVNKVCKNAEQWGYHKQGDSYICSNSITYNSNLSSTDFATNNVLRIQGDTAACQCANNYAPFGINLCRKLPSGSVYYPGNINESLQCTEVIGGSIYNERLGVCSCVGVGGGNGAVLVPHIQNGSLAWQCSTLGCPVDSTAQSAADTSMYGRYCIPNKDKCFKQINGIDMVVQDITDNDYVANGVCYDLVETTKISQAVQ